ncbi:MAG: hypothetical protein J0H15_07735 [Xanthomonadales bacterium]|nr:hypothetical protein [Xanthomonadales bacterium]
MSKRTVVKLDALEEALTFAVPGEAEAWVCRDTGAMLWHSAYTDDSGPLPEDIHDASHYVPVPDKHDLGLGKPLAVEFARIHLPECEEQVYGIFARRGAYARFKALLERHQQLDTWHRWEEAQTRQALRNWCADNDMEVAD